MGYIIKYAVVWEAYDGAYPNSNDWECDIPEFLFDSEEDAEEFIEDMKKED